MLLVRNMQQCKITNLHNKKTKEGTKYACNILKDFCAARREVGGQIESSNEEELRELLCDFYANVRSKDGEIYKKSSLYVIKFSFFLKETFSFALRPIASHWDLFLCAGPIAFHWDLFLRSSFGTVLYLLNRRL